VNGVVLHTFTDVRLPRYLSVDNNDDILVADYDNDRILLLNSQVHLERVLINTNSQVKLWRPEQLYLNELTSELFILHHTSDDWQAPDVISKFILR